MYADLGGIGWIGRYTLYKTRMPKFKKFS